MIEETEILGKWRRRLWPVHSFELRKIVPLLFLKFFVSLNFTILANLKDTLVVTAKNSGAEVIPVLKGWIVLPIAILVTLLYSKFSNHFKTSTIFYASILYFFVAVLGYAYFIYPNMDFLTPSKSSDWLQSALGNHYSHWIAIYRNWYHTFFFVTAELWSTIVIFVLYWGLANQINTVSEAKRTYTLFIAAGDVGAILTGPIVAYFSKKYILQDYSLTLKSLSLIVAAICLIVMLLYWWMEKNVIHDPNLCDQDQINRGFKTKNKLSLWKSIKYIASSKYLLSIAILVIGCALSINMIEVTWKAKMKIAFPSPAEYQAFYGNVTSFIGFFALITVILFGGNSLRKFGWHFSAQIAPILIGLTGVVFFILCINEHLLGNFTSWLGITPLMLIVFFGAFQNIVSKVVKYSFFDSTKEMVFIPLDQEAKTKGKAAIDVVGSRLGKSGSSWIQVGLIQIAGTGSVLAITPYLLPIVIFAIFCWMSSVRYLNREFAQQHNLSTPSAEKVTT